MITCKVTVVKIFFSVINKHQLYILRFRNCNCTEMLIKVHHFVHINIFKISGRADRAIDIKLPR